MPEILLLAIVAPFLLGGILFLLARARRPQLSSELRAKVARELVAFEAEPDPEKAVLAGDRLLDFLLGARGGQGSFAEKFRGPAEKELPRELREAVWRAHKLRNKLAHEVGFSAGEGEVAAARRAFAAAVRKFLAALTAIILLLSAPAGAKFVLSDYEGPIVESEGFRINFSLGNSRRPLPGGGGLELSADMADLIQDWRSGGIGLFTWGAQRKRSAEEDAVQKACESRGLSREACSNLLDSLLGNRESMPIDEYVSAEAGLLSAAAKKRKVGKLKKELESSKIREAFWNGDPNDLSPYDVFFEIQKLKAMWGCADAARGAPATVKLSVEVDDFEACDGSGTFCSFVRLENEEAPTLDEKRDDCVLAHLQFLAEGIRKAAKLPHSFWKSPTLPMVPGNANKYSYFKLPKWGPILVEWVPMNGGRWVDLAGTLASKWEVLENWKWMREEDPTAQKKLALRSEVACREKVFSARGINANQWNNFAPSFQQVLQQEISNCQQQEALGTWNSFLNSAAEWQEKIAGFVEWPKSQLDQVAQILDGKFLKESNICEDRNLATNFIQTARDAGPLPLDWITENSEKLCEAISEGQLTGEDESRRSATFAATQSSGVKSFRQAVAGVQESISGVVAATKGLEILFKQMSELPPAKVQG